VIESLAGQGFDVQRACVMLGVSASGYYAWKDRPPSTRTLRHMWLAGEIAQVHKDSGGTYGVRRVTAELRHGRGVTVGHNQVELVMGRLGLHGLPKRRLPRGAKLGKPNSLDLVRRRFRSDAPDLLWMTDITEHPTREGKVYCCAVLDAFSRMVVGWSIDSSQTALLVTNALGMALARRTPGHQAIIHSDQGVQFGSWAFSQKVTDAGLAPSVGAIGAPFDNAMVEAFWARMQVELLNRQRWKTRVELASAIHDYIEIWHNTKRRHSALNMLTPIEYEMNHTTTTGARPVDMTGCGQQADHSPWTTLRVAHMTTGPTPTNNNHDR
jgi:putative transposase